MKAVLMSIKPKWCEKIFSGKMTIKVCKTAFKVETPFKVYVYCTKERMTRVPSLNAYLHKNEPKACAEYGTIETWSEIGDVIVNPHLASKHVSFGMHGKVVGEFVCDKVKKYASYKIYDLLVPQEIDIYKVWDKEMTGLTYKDLCDYGKGKPLYGLHITEPKLYDKPKELNVFWSVRCTNKTGDCKKCEVKPACINNITRPPSSWCYVEEVVE